MWADLPNEHPSTPPAFQRVSGEVKEGTLSRLLEALTQDLQIAVGIDLTECFIDGIFVEKKREHKAGKTKRGKSMKLMAIADAAGLPLAMHTALLVHMRSLCPSHRR